MAAASAYVPSRPPAAPSVSDAIPGSPQPHNEDNTEELGQDMTEHSGGLEPKLEFQSLSTRRARLKEYASNIVDAMNAYRYILDDQYLNDYIERHPEVRGGASMETYNLLYNSNEMDPSILETYENVHEHGAVKFPKLKSLDISSYCFSKSALRSSFPKLYDHLMLRRCNALQSISCTLDQCLPFFPIRSIGSPKRVPGCCTIEWQSLVSQLVDLTGNMREQAKAYSTSIDIISSLKELLKSTEGFNPLEFYIECMSQSHVTPRWKRRELCSASSPSSVEKHTPLCAIDGNIKSSWKSVRGDHYSQWSCHLRYPSEVDVIEVRPDPYFLCRRYEVDVTDCSGGTLMLGSVDGSISQVLRVHTTMRPRVKKVTIRAFPFPNQQYVAIQRVDVYGLQEKESWSDLVNQIVENFESFLLDIEAQVPTSRGENASSTGLETNCAGAIWYMIALLLRFSCISGMNVFFMLAVRALNIVWRHATTLQTTETEAAQTAISELKKLRCLLKALARSEADIACLKGYFRDTSVHMFQQFRELCGRHEKMELLDMEWDEASSVGVDIGKTGVSCSSARKVACAVGNVFLSGASETYSWEFTLLADKPENECTCFGIASYPVTQVAYDKNESSVLFRAINGKVYKNGVIQDHRAAKCHPGDKVRFILDHQESKLFYQVSSSATWYSADIQGLDNLVPVVMFYSTQREVLISSPVVTFRDYDLYKLWTQSALFSDPWEDIPRKPTEALRCSFKENRVSSSRYSVVSTDRNRSSGSKMSARELRESEAILETVKGQEWSCQSCTYANAPGSSSCEMCGTSKPSDMELAVQSLPWNCPQCTFENSGVAKCCSICEATAPAVEQRLYVLVTQRLQSCRNVERDDHAIKERKHFNENECERFSQCIATAVDLMSDHENEENQLQEVLNEAFQSLAELSSKQLRDIKSPNPQDLFLRMSVFGHSSFSFSIRCVCLLLKSSIDTHDDSILVPTLQLLRDNIRRQLLHKPEVEGNLSDRDSSESGTVIDALEYMLKRVQDLSSAACDVLQNTVQALCSSDKLPVQHQVKLMNMFTYYQFEASDKFPNSGISGMLNRIYSNENGDHEEQALAISWRQNFIRECIRQDCEETGKTLFDRLLLLTDFERHDSSFTVTFMGEYLLELFRICEKIMKKESIMQEYCMFSTTTEDQDNGRTQEKWNSISAHLLRICRTCFTSFSERLHVNNWLMMVLFFHILRIIDVVPSSVTDVARRLGSPPQPDFSRFSFAEDIETSFGVNFTCPGHWCRFLCSIGMCAEATNKLLGGTGALGIANCSTSHFNMDWRSQWSLGSLCENFVDILESFAPAFNSTIYNENSSDIENFGQRELTAEEFLAVENASVLSERSVCTEKLSHYTSWMNLIGSCASSALSNGNRLENSDAPASIYTGGKLLPLTSDDSTHCIRQMRANIIASCRELNTNCTDSCALYRTFHSVFGHVLKRLYLGVCNRPSVQLSGAIMQRQINSCFLRNDLSTGDRNEDVLKKLLDGSLKFCPLEFSTTEIEEKFRKFESPRISHALSILLLTVNESTKLSPLLRKSSSRLTFLEAYFFLASVRLANDLDNLHYCVSSIIKSDDEWVMGRTLDSIDKMEVPPSLKRAWYYTCQFRRWLSGKTAEEHTQGDDATGSKAFVQSLLSLEDHKQMKSPHYLAEKAIDGLFMLPVIRSNDLESLLKHCLQTARRLYGSVQPKAVHQYLLSKRDHSKYRYMSLERANRVCRNVGDEYTFLGFLSVFFEYSAMDSHFNDVLGHVKSLIDNAYNVGVLLNHSHSIDSNEHLYWQGNREEVFGLIREQLRGTHLRQVPVHGGLVPVHKDSSIERGSETSLPQFSIVKHAFERFINVIISGWKSVSPLFPKVFMSLGNCGGTEGQRYHELIRLMISSVEEDVLSLELMEALIDMKYCHYAVEGDINPCLEFQQDELQFLLWIPELLLRNLRDKANVVTSSRLLGEELMLLILVCDKNSVVFSRHPQRLCNLLINSLLLGNPLVKKRSISVLQRVRHLTPCSTFDSSVQECIEWAVPSLSSSISGQTLFQLLLDILAATFFSGVDEHSPSKLQRLGFSVLDERIAYAPGYGHSVTSIRESVCMFVRECLDQNVCPREDTIGSDWNKKAYEAVSYELTRHRDESKESLISLVGVMHILSGSVGTLVPGSHVKSWHSESWREGVLSVVCEGIESNRQLFDTPGLRAPSEDLLTRLSMDTGSSLTLAVRYSRRQLVCLDLGFLGDDDLAEHDVNNLRVDVSTLVNTGKVQCSSIAEFVPVTYTGHFLKVFEAEALLDNCLSILENTSKNASYSDSLATCVRLLTVQLLQRMSVTDTFIGGFPEKTINKVLSVAAKTSSLPRFLRPGHIRGRLAWLENFRIEHQRASIYLSQRHSSTGSVDERMKGVSPEALEHLQALGYGRNLCLKALEFNQFDANAAAQWLLSGQAEAFVKGGGLSDTNEEGSNSSLDVQAKDLALAVGKHPKLSQHALEMHHGNKNAAMEWLLDYGNYYSELPEYSVTDSVKSEDHQQCIEMKDSDYFEENALYTIDEGSHATGANSDVSVLNSGSNEAREEKDICKRRTEREPCLPVKLDNLLVSAGGISGTRFTKGLSLVWFQSPSHFSNVVNFETMQEACIVTVAEEYPSKDRLQIKYGECETGVVKMDSAQLDMLYSIESIGDIDLSESSAIVNCWAVHTEALLYAECRRLLLSCLIARQCRSTFSLPKLLTPKSFVALVKLTASSECIFQDFDGTGGQQLAARGFGSAADTPVMKLLRSLLACALLTHSPSPPPRYGSLKEGSGHNSGNNLIGSNEASSDASPMAFMKQMQSKMNKFLNFNSNADASACSTTFSQTPGSAMGALNLKECESLTEQLVQDTAWNVAMATKLDTSGKPIVRESLHPHFWKCTYGETLQYRGARALMVKFDARCELGDKSKLEFHSSKGDLLRSVKSNNMDLSQIVVHGDSIAYSFTSDAEGPSAWGFKFYVAPVQGIQWITEEDVLNQSSLEWSCWILEFLIRLPSHQALSNFVNFEPILNALLRYIQHPSAPFKTQAVYILIKAFRSPQLIQKDIRLQFTSLERIGGSIESYWSNQRNSGNLFMSAHVQAVAEMCASAQNAKEQLSQGITFRSFDFDNDVIHGGLWRKSKLRNPVNKDQSGIKSENDMGVVESMKDVIQICEAFLANARLPDHLVCAISLALTHKDSWGIFSQGTSTIRSAANKLSEKKCEEVVLSILNWTRDASLELCKLAATVCKSCGDVNYALPPGKIRKDDIDVAEYASLEKYTEIQLQSMFGMIQLLNRRLMKCLELIDLSRTEHDYALGSHLRRLSYCIFSETKQALVEAVIDATWEVGARTMRCILNNNVAFQARDAGITDPSLSQCIFMQAYWQLGEQPAANFRGHVDSRGRLFVVKFQDEDGVDWGGLYRDTIMRMIDDVFSDQLDLCIRVPNATSDNGNNADKFVPNPRQDTPLCSSIYRFLGRLMGVACRQRQYLPVMFPSFVWKKLVGQEVELSDIAGIDITFAQRYMELEKLYKQYKDESASSANGETPSSVGQKFTVWSVDSSEVPLISGGSQKEVQVDELSTYLKLALEFRKSELDNQIASLFEGIADVIPRRAISLCRWEELESLVCGDPHIDIEALKSNAIYQGYSKNDKACKFFWNALESFNNEQRSKFLRFVWGRSRLPRGGDWERSFRITKRQGGDNQLPVGHTCFFQIELPSYSSEEVARKRLLTAISYGLDGFLLI